MAQLGVRVVVHQGIRGHHVRADLLGALHGHLDRGQPQGRQQLPEQGTQQADPRPCHHAHQEALLPARKVLVTMMSPRRYVHE